MLVAGELGVCWTLCWTPTQGEPHVTTAADAGERVRIESWPVLKRSHLSFGDQTGATCPPGQGHCIKDWRHWCSLGTSNIRGQQRSGALIEKFRVTGEGEQAPCTGYGGQWGVSTPPTRFNQRSFYAPFHSGASVGDKQTVLRTNGCLWYCLHRSLTLAGQERLARHRHPNPKQM